MTNTPRKDIHLSLTGDQYDDLTSALETQRNSFEHLAAEASNGFGYLDTAYWTHRVTEVQQLIDTVHRLALGANPQGVKQEAQGNAAKHLPPDSGTEVAPED
ncbi:MULTISPECIES: hypothetical protein [Micrococcaceae]|jgi:hypothetical protein|uniref:hypothetical protein n=1 Tax=Micrococcaceae TaxID=1268 RepID=UPI00063DD35D|nr:hypothetical protein [Arthrobacter sp. YC-RL1]ALQ31678.1 hypothetical protein ATC04_14705 [Arthrobacter sp. YC-RL1]KLI89853.1 hypothetical protein AA310_04200 [Arthrobacter sp. YC-RL1]